MALAYAGRGRETALSGHHELRRQAGWLQHTLSPMLHDAVETLTPLPLHHLSDERCSHLDHDVDPQFMKERARCRTCARTIINCSYLSIGWTSIVPGCYRGPSGPKPNGMATRAWNGTSSHHHAVHQLKPMRVHWLQALSAASQLTESNL